jgi:hypothetical protein
VKQRDDEAARVLCCGLDSLVLSLDVTWKSRTFFICLEELKGQARAIDVEVPVDLCVPGEDFSTFNVRPHGAEGYEWLLVGREASWRIADRMTPGSRPSVMVDIRSETLWHQGPEHAVRRLRSMVEGVDGVVHVMKVSRADLCMDLLVPASLWSADLLDHAVTRADHTAPHFSRRRLTGLSIGKGGICARLYDKPLEIATKSKKLWMYDLWKLDAVPADRRVIRAEFQMRREVIKELGINTFEDLMQRLPGVWGYCTRYWLKFQDDASKHHTMQQTMPWWSVVQDGYTGSQGALPLVREKAIRQDKRQLLHQVFGLLSSWAALEVQGLDIGQDPRRSMKAEIPALRQALAAVGLGDDALTERVLRKLAKYRRAQAT